MYLDSAKKAEIFGKYGKSNTDTGSCEAQIALFSYRIAHLTEHMKSNHKDYTTQRSLKALVGKRRRQLDYLKERDIERYRAIVRLLIFVSNSYRSKKGQSTKQKCLVLSFYVAILFKRTNSFTLATLQLHR